MASSRIPFGQQIPLPSSDTEDEEEYELPVSSSMMLQSAKGGISVVDMVAAVLRRSLLLCSTARAEEDEESGAAGMHIGRPTEVRHLSHVTFDRFFGFLGLPSDLEPEVPRPAPSASVNVFGVSPTTMQCSFDIRGNSVPTILLTMQRKLYLLGGLQVEGIFRISADDSQERDVREKLNRGVVPDGVDLHCLAGLIKAWFRELPTGVLDSLTAEQVMHCNTEDECAIVASMVPSVEAALLDWAINLMADVVEHENYNKMNARNIAMVFAPNMTQMSDPLTALMHAVQVMNFLKTLILKTVREREEAAISAREFTSNSGSPGDKDEPQTLDHLNKPIICSSQENAERPMINGATLDHFLFRVEQALYHDAQGSIGESDKYDNHDKIDIEFFPWDNDFSSKVNCSGNKFRNESMEGLFDRCLMKQGRLLYDMVGCNR